MLVLMTWVDTIMTTVKCTKINTSNAQCQNVLRSTFRLTIAGKSYEFSGVWGATTPEARLTPLPVDMTMEIDTHSEED